MEKQESKVNPELQRVAELLRPLWPGVVMVGTLSLRGGAGYIQLEVCSGDDPWRGWATVWANGKLLHRVFWRSEVEAGERLKEQHDFVVALTADLHSALGLEVSDG